MTGRQTEEEEFLLDQREFLLASLRDLEAEYAAGDMDDDDYRTLKADYTARAAAVIRSIEAGVAAGDGEDEHDGDSSGAWRRRLVGIGLVTVIAVVAGVLVAQSSGRRGGGGLTGLDVSAASSRLGDCQQMEVESELDEALACYDEILVSLPANVGALTFRGWLRVRAFDAEAGLDDLDQAITLAPDQTAAYIFRASGRARTGDAPGAVADLAAFYANEPNDEERGLAEGFAPGIVNAALDTCVAGDVSGDMELVAVAQCYQDILAVDADNATANVYLGWLLGRSGLGAEALALLDAGLEADASLSAGYVFRAAVRAHEGDIEGALADLDHFDTLDDADLPAAQLSAAAEVRAAVEAGEDPLG